MGAAARADASARQPPGSGGKQSSTPAEPACTSSAEPNHAAGGESSSLDSGKQIDLRASFFRKLALYFMGRRRLIRLVHHQRDWERSAGRDGGRSEGERISSRWRTARYVHA